MMRLHSTRERSAVLVLGLATCIAGLVPAWGATREAHVDEILGTWRLKSTSPDGEKRELILVLSRPGGVLRGVYTADQVTRPARDVGFARGELSFGVDGTHGGRAYTLTYKGKPRADSLRGAVHWKYGWASGSFAFVGERLGRKVAMSDGPRPLEADGRR
jgi:hypothetical protein